MGAIVNGLSLFKLRAFGATFFIFSDYARPAIRLSALAYRCIMRLRHKPAVLALSRQPLPTLDRSR